MPGQSTPLKYAGERGVLRTLDVFAAMEGVEEHRIASHRIASHRIASQRSAAQRSAAQRSASHSIA
jgi:hypothetical protein